MVITKDTGRSLEAIKSNDAVPCFSFISSSHWKGTHVIPQSFAVVNFFPVGFSQIKCVVVPLIMSILYVPPNWSVKSSISFLRSKIK